MMQHIKSLLILIGVLIFTAPVFCQATLQWHWKDLTQEGWHGVSLEKAKQQLDATGITPKPIIIAILDGGIDTNHVALKDFLWTNPKEIPNNQIDDDRNGYIDDTHGWNFLGGKDGRNIDKLSDEKSRIYHAYKSLYSQPDFDSTQLNAADKKKFHQWLMAANEINFSQEDQANLEYIKISRNVLKRIATTIVKEIADSNFSVSKLESFQPLSRIGLEAKLAYIKTNTVLGIDTSSPYLDLIKDLDDYIESKEKAAIAKEQAPIPLRAQIIQDNYDNFKDAFYGNNDIMGPNAKHGTHVAGLASNKNAAIKIMGVRVVPDGDEYDKDIALGIRYAVDNGAKVINMSFGKSFSPQQNWVDSAIRYAAQKDVLLIHSAGNEKYDLNNKEVFPTPYSDLFKDSAQNMITVAASSDSLIKGALLTDFSNYGNKLVDLIAPGDKIYSTLPNNNYGYLSGTSMASPIVSHIAALIRAYYPTLSAREVKQILMRSSWSPTDTTTLSQLAPIAKTAGIVNAYNAVQMAPHFNRPEKAKKKNK